MFTFIHPRSQIAEKKVTLYKKLLWKYFFLVHEQLMGSRTNIIKETDYKVEHQEKTLYDREKTEFYNGLLKEMEKAGIKIEFKDKGNIIF